MKNTQRSFTELTFSSLWTIKLSALLFLTRLTSQFWSATSSTTTKPQSKRTLQRLLGPLLYTFLGITLLSALITPLAECQPFNDNFQVSPAPAPSCRLGYAQVIVFSTACILSDAALIAFPIPMLLRARLQRKTKFSLIILLSFPIFSIGFTIFRVITVLDKSGSQGYRTLTASLDMLVATMSSNALVVMTFLQDKGLKKERYKYNPELSRELTGTY